MIARIERPLSRSAVWSRRLGGFAVVLMVIAGAGHRYGFVETVVLFWTFVIVGVLAVVAGLAATVAFQRIWYHGDRGGRDLVWGMLWAAVVAVPFLFAGYQYLTNPSLNDISTDPTDPPPLAEASKLRTGQMNPVAAPSETLATVQLENFPDITGRRYDLTIERMRTAVEALIVRRGWRPLKTTAEPFTGVVVIEATAGSPILWLPADVSLRIIDEGPSTYVDMRSASRYGQHDLGDNARRIDAFLIDLDAEVAAQAGIPDAADGP